MSELQRKTLIAAAAAALNVPYALIWLKSTDAAENLGVSMNVAEAVVAGLIVYAALRLSSAFFFDQGALSTLNVAYLVIDFSIVGFVVIVTGGQHSVFFNLWWAPVVSATIFFGIAGAVCTSLAVAFIYPLVTIVAHRFFGSFFSLSAVLSSISAFTLVSLMLGLLIHEERRQRQTRELVNRSTQQIEKEHRELQRRLDKVSLTKREIEVLSLVKKGLDNVQIATNLFVTKSAVKKHVSSILLKFDVDNRTQAAVLAERGELARAKHTPGAVDAAHVKIGEDHRTTLLNFFFIYRWAMLLLALFMIFNHAYVKVDSTVAATAWMVAFTYTAAIHYFRGVVVTRLQRNPRLIAADIGFGAMLLTVGGGWQNVFFAYAMAPVFASVVLYGLAGGLGAATAASLGMIVSMWLVGDTFAEITRQGALNPFIATIGGFYLVGYFSTLPAQLIERAAGRQLLNQLFLEKLSEPKREIVMLVSEGKTDAEIAQVLHRSESTVKKHLKEILRQFELKNRVQIATLVSQNAVIPASPAPPNMKKRPFSKNSYNQ